MDFHVTLKQILKRTGSQVWSVEPEFSVLEELRSMLKKNFGEVVEGGKILGDISIENVFRELIEGRKFVIDQLVLHISGERPKPPLSNPLGVELP